MISATFHDWGGRANDPDFSIDHTWSTASIRTPKILDIIRRNCYTSQGDPDSIFPYLLEGQSLEDTILHLQLPIVY